MSKSYKPEERAKVGLAAALDEGISEMTTLGEELREWADNMSNSNMDHLPKYEEVDSAATLLEEVANPDEIPECLSAVTVDFTVQRQRRKGKSESRQVRLDNALEAISAVITTCEGMIEGLSPDPLDEDDKTEIQEFLSAVQDIFDNVGSVEMPGMY